MEQIVITNTFRGEGSYDPEYRMYLVINEYYEDFMPIEPFIQLIINFGKVLEDKARITIPLKTAYLKTRRSILRLTWDDKTWEQLNQTKELYVLIIKSPLSTFKPKKDPFIIMWFPEAVSNPSQYIKILDSIAKEIEHGNDIFQWHSKQSKNASKFLKRIYSAIQLKPGMFGFSIDIKKLLRNRLRNRLVSPIKRPRVKRKNVPEGKKDYFSCQSIPLQLPAPLPLPRFQGNQRGTLLV